MHRQQVRRTKLDLHRLPDAAPGAAGRGERSRVTYHGPVSRRRPPGGADPRSGRRLDYRRSAEAFGETGQRLVNRAKPRHDHVCLQRCGVEGSFQAPDMPVQQLRQCAQPRHGVGVQNVDFVGLFGAVGVIMRHPPASCCPDTASGRTTLRDIKARSYRRFIPLAIYLFVCNPL